MPATLPRPVQALCSCLLALTLVLWHHLPATAQTATPTPAATPAPAATTTRPAGPSYQLQSYVLDYGDSLNVVVVGNEQLKIEEQPIRPDGRISLPLIGEVQAGGQTVVQLSAVITKLYTKFFVDPKIVVNVAKFRPLQISVLGKVQKPGTFPIAEPIRLVPALALAGGLEDRGNPTTVLVLRANGERQTVNLIEVFEGKVDDNVLLFNGDTVRVEEVTGLDWYRILPPLASALSITSTIVILLVNLARN